MVISKFKHIVPLYDFGKPSLTIIVCDREAYEKEIKVIDKNNENKEDRPNYNQFSGYTFCKTVKGIDTYYSMYAIDTLIDKQGDIDMNTIGHEATHIKNHIYYSLGIEPDTDKDEPEAYFMGWIVEMLCKDIKKYLKKNNNEKPN